VRAAAKNHAHVYVAVDPGDFSRVIASLQAGDATAGLALRRELAVKAFRHTGRYDAAISTWLSKELGHTDPPQEMAVGMRRLQECRYGENPHQRAAFYADTDTSGRSLARAEQLQGKELSFNNIADADGAVRAVFDFEEPACAIIKHMNPCGLATADSLAEAFRRALDGDPVSAYGGIVAFNRPVGPEDVRAVRSSKTFFEVLCAPGFLGDARERLAGRANLRVLELPADWAASRPPGFDARRVQGGWLLQDWDLGAPVTWEVATKRAPTEAETVALRFAWRAVRHVKSNAITLAVPHAEGARLNGVGAGQMSRVDSVRLAIEKATAPVAGSVMASDAFFPFADGVVVAVEAGVTAIVQPGGSIRDDEVVAAADAAGVAMVFTGARHFRH
jgi:phosphoribosylaminoimidazolecarboxamide formyltransferase/IMP cyclohydrolase